MAVSPERNNISVISIHWIGEIVHISDSLWASGISFSSKKFEDILKQV
jgi:hypothetical protein